MPDIAKRILIALFASGAIATLIYFALDHWLNLATRPKIRTTLKLLFLLSTLGSAAYQFYSADLDRKQAAEDRHQAAEDRQRAARNDADYRKQISDLKDTIRSNAHDYARLQIDTQEQLQTERLNLAKAQSQADLRAVETELSDWADTFSTNAQERATQFANLKQSIKDAQTEAERVAQENEKQARRKFTAETYAPTYFALHLVQDTVRAYAKKTGEDIKIDPIELPDDFFEREVHGQITFPSLAVWSLTTSVQRGSLLFRVQFTDPNHSATGELFTLINLAQHTIGINYSAKPPVPDPATVRGNHDLSDYETFIKRAYLRVLPIQLLNTVNPTPTADSHH